MLTMSMSWNRACRFSRRAFWPVIATSGAPISCAWATPVMRFVAPGPERGKADARLARQPAVGGCHERGRLFVPGDDDLDAASPEGFEKVEVLLAGQAEDVFNAFFFQLLHEQVRCFHSFSQRNLPQRHGDTEKSTQKHSDTRRALKTRKENLDLCQAATHEHKITALIR